MSIKISNDTIGNRTRFVAQCVNQLRLRVSRQESSSYLTILGALTVIFSNFHAEDPQILGTTVQFIPCGSLVSRDMSAL